VECALRVIVRPMPTKDPKLFVAITNVACLQPKNPLGLRLWHCLASRESFAHERLAHPHRPFVFAESIKAVRPWAESIDGRLQWGNRVQLVSLARRRDKQFLMDATCGPAISLATIIKYDALWGALRRTRAGPGIGQQPLCHTIFAGVTADNRRG
jgi:hypothetical protein